MEFDLEGATLVVKGECTVREFYRIFRIFRGVMDFLHTPSTVFNKINPEYSQSDGQDH